ncbi:hypothetical protein [Pseudomonas brenneri]|uniref:hypothetical protein n=1 Tax=Pseudomonas brenneri TaxID=129817 RepID=UPI003BA10D4E
MPLPVTPYFEQRLVRVRVLSPEVARLAEDIAAAQKPEVLKESVERQTERLFDRMDEVARQEDGCATKLGVWLSTLAGFKGLAQPEVEAFALRATELGGPKAVVDHDLA